MGVIADEQNVKRPTQFLKYESGDQGNQLMLKSKLYKIDSHFLNAQRTSVVCRGDDCMYCGSGYQKRTEFNYYVYLNGETGFLDIKPSVFFAIQAIAKAQHRDVREISWTVIKKGDDLLTKYTVSKDDNLAPEDFEHVQEELSDNTSKLETLMERREEQLEQGYTQNLKNIKRQDQNKVTSKKEEVEEQEEEPEVNPEDVPF